MNTTKLHPRVSARLIIIVITACLIVFGALQFLEANPKQVAVTPAPRLSVDEFSYESSKLTDLVDKDSPKDAFAYIEDNLPTNPSFARDCHPLLHEVGHEAFHKYGSFSEAIKFQNELCNSGYTHGVIESAFDHTKDISSLVKTICNIDSQTKFQQWECFHGVGHGVMIYSNQDVNKSLELCAKLPSQFATDSCKNGLFMERFVVIDHIGNINPKKTVDLNFCELQQPENKADCYLYAPSGYLTIHTNEYKAALEWCKGSQPNYYQACIRGVGTQVMKDNITQPTIALSICDKAPKNTNDTCIRGAVGLQIVNDGSVQRAKELCQNEFKKYKIACVEEVSASQSLLSL